LAEDFSAGFCGELSLAIRLFKLPASGHFCGSTLWTDATTTSKAAMVFLVSCLRSGITIQPDRSATIGLAVPYFDALI
jgi:hypothetical protein